MISSFKKVLKNDSIKWTEPSNIHITLVFLGDTEESKIREIDTSLSEVCQHFKNFELILEGSGVFRSFNDPRVLWTGIQRSEEMIRLNKQINSNLIAAGFKLDVRPYNPHLTLGRLKRIRDISLLEDQVRQYAGMEVQRITVSQIILYESILRQEGPLYKPLGIYSFK